MIDTFPLALAPIDPLFALVERSRRVRRWRAIARAMGYSRDDIWFVRDEVRWGRLTCAPPSVS